MQAGPHRAGIGAVMMLVTPPCQRSITPRAPFPAALTGQEGLLQLSIPQHAGPGPVEHLAVEPWDTEGTGGVSAEPTSSFPTRGERPGIGNTALPRPSRRHWGEVRLQRCSWGALHRAERGAVCVPGCALRLGALLLRTLFFQRLDEPGHGGQRLLGEGGVLGELCLPGESCGEKKGRRGLEIPARRNSTFLCCPRTGSSCCFGTATNNTLAHTCLILERFSLYFILFLQ